MYAIFQLQLTFACMTVSPSVLFVPLLSLQEIVIGLQLQTQTNQSPLDDPQARNARMLGY